MITTEDGSLTYASTVHPFLSWRPQSDVLFVLSVALVTTLISYHATAIIFNLTLGTKPKRLATVSDLGTSRLLMSSSPLALFRNICPNLYRAACVKGIISPPREVSYETPPQTRSHPTVMFKLVFLLTVAPLMNVIAIFSSMEYEKDLTFADSGIGGLATGMNEDLSTLKSTRLDFSGYSAEIPIDAYQYDDLFVRFLLIADAAVQESQHNVSHPNHALFDMFIVPDGSVQSTFICESFQVSIRASLNVEYLRGPNRGNVYVVDTLRPDSSLARISEVATKKLVDSCGTDLEQYGASAENTVDGITNLRSEFNCSLSPADSRTVKDLLLTVCEKITLVESESLKVTAIEKNLTASSPANDLVFLRRKRNYASLPVLIVVLASLSIFRIIITFVTRNDLSIGVGLIIKDVLGVGRSETMLVHSVNSVAEGMCPVDIMRSATEDDTDGSAVEHF